MTNIVVASIIDGFFNTAALKRSKGLESATRLAYYARKRDQRMSLAMLPTSSSTAAAAAASFQSAGFSGGGGSSDEESKSGGGGGGGGGSGRGFAMSTHARLPRWRRRGQPAVAPMAASWSGHSGRLPFRGSHDSGGGGGGGGSDDDDGGAKRGGRGRATSADGHAVFQVEAGAESPRSRSLSGANFWDQKVGGSRDATVFLRGVVDSGDDDDDDDDDDEEEEESL